MTDPEDEIARLVGEARELPDGALKVELLDQAARVADTLNDVKRAFALRKAVIGAALAAGMPEQMAVAFTWCVAQSDRDPENVPPTDILWQYRWVISELPNFPEVPRGQIEDTIREMVRRYRAAGSTLRPVHLMRMFTYCKLGDLAAAEAAYQEWRPTERDWLSDSPRQEQNLVVHFLACAGRHQDVIDACPSVLAGRVDDANLFGQDSAEVLGPLVELGRVADAVRVQRSGYRYLAKQPGYLHHMGLNLEFLARVENWATATKVLEDHVGIAMTTKQNYDRFQFFRGWLVTAERLRKAGHERFKLRLPDSVPVPAGNRQYPLAELAGWLRNDLRDLAARFDARNGTTYFADRLAKADDLIARPKATA